MAKAVQYSIDNGMSFAQLPEGGLTDIDIQQVDNDNVQTTTFCTHFTSCKDGEDNLYILGTQNTTDDRKARLIKIGNDGSKVIGNIDVLRSGRHRYFAPIIHLASNGYLYVLLGPPRVDNDYRDLYVSKIDKNFSSGLVTVTHIHSAESQVDAAVAGTRFTTYRELWLFIVFRRTLYVYDMSYENLLWSGEIPITYDTCKSLVCDSEGNLYSWTLRTVGGGDGMSISKHIFNGTDVTTSLIYQSNDSSHESNYQMVMDVWGDFVTIWWDGSDAKLQKINGSTGLVVDGIVIGLVQYYNLNTDIDGNYYYSNVLGYWKIPTNTEQGQEFNTPVKINDTGSATYHNNDTGFNASIL